MTALVSVFVRAYHSWNHGGKIYDDPLAAQILTPEEYAGIAESMTEGMAFFRPGFNGAPEEALRWIVENQLAPSVLGRAAFAEQALEKAMEEGMEQYVILGAGYDTFAWRRPVWADGLRVFEVDRPAIGRDKRRRAENLSDGTPTNLFFVEADFEEQRPLRGLKDSASYRTDRRTFFSLPGVVYYLPQDGFTELLREIAEIAPVGSRLAFDYPDENTHTEKAGERARKQVAMAAAASEKMLAGYSREQMEAKLSACGFSVCEHLMPEDITERFFLPYNRKNPAHPMTAFDNVNYCLARLTASRCE